jgi:hypothetical protein
LEERSNGIGKLAEASKEGQGPRRAVEPMMMFYAHKNKIYYICHDIYSRR